MRTEDMTPEMTSVVKQFNLKQLQSAWTGELFETWFREDMLFFIESPLVERGKVVEGYRILSNTNDVTKIGHINFSELRFTSFEDAAKALVSLSTTKIRGLN